MKLVEVGESRKRARWLKLPSVNTFALIDWDQESGVRDQGVLGFRETPGPQTQHPLTPDS